MTNPVLLDRKGAVAYITLNRPNEGNAINAPLARALLAAVAEVEIDHSVRCVVLRGNGRMFCVGGDVKALHGAGEELPVLLNDILMHLHPSISRLAGMAKPVISAVHGPCAGGGVGLAAVGDIVLAEPAAHFTMAYSRIGLSPDGGATWLLPRLVGLRRAQELTITNRRVPADEAVRIGLITEVVVEGTLAQRVEKLAGEIADSAVGALGRTKRLLLAGADAALAAQLNAESEKILEQAAGSEGRSGLAAFIEGRKPSFGG